MDGTPFDGASLAGRPTVLWFWAPWCPTCIAEAPDMAEMSEDFTGRANVIGVGGLDQADAMEGFVSRYDVAGFPHLVDEDGAVWRHFGVTQQSSYVVLDPSGAVVFRGWLPADELADRVSGLMG